MFSTRKEVSSYLKVSYYDGDDILDACPKEAIQSRIGVYHPNQFLNYASIKSNISYDIYKHSNTSIDNVFDLELDKVAFYNGVNLSQGERQKVLLSRTLNKKADVYIFDEPTSNLDEPSKRLFFKCKYIFISSCSSNTQKQV